MNKETETYFLLSHFHSYGMHRKIKRAYKLIYFDIYVDSSSGQFSKTI